MKKDLDSPKKGLQFVKKKFNMMHPHTCVATYEATNGAIWHKETENSSLLFYKFSILLNLATKNNETITKISSTEDKIFNESLYTRLYG